MRRVCHCPLFLARILLLLFPDGDSDGLRNGFHNVLFCIPFLHCPWERDCRRIDALYIYRLLKTQRFVVVGRKRRKRNHRHNTRECVPRHKLRVIHIHALSYIYVVNIIGFIHSRSRRVIANILRSINIHALHNVRRDIGIYLANFLHGFSFFFSECNCPVSIKHCVAISI